MRGTRGQRPVGVSWIWFFLLAISGRKIGQVDKNGTFLKRMNQVSALIIWIMAIYMGYQLSSLVN
jgi:L-lysine exporter family protein LysE/ArgO